MYGHSSTISPRAHNPPSPDAAAFLSAAQIPAAAAQLIIPHHLAALEVGSSSNSYDSPSSLPSCCSTQQPSLIQRSTSSHSLVQRAGYHCHFHQDLLDFDSGPFRRVFSTGDLQHGHKADSPLSSESNAIIESMSRACKYSPEEKKERIERYKSKRTQRNFNKKIKYACRKTLADSRPRVRGRFARNDEIEKNVEAQWSNEEDIEDNCDDWIHLLNAFSANSLP